MNGSNRKECNLKTFQSVIYDGYWNKKIQCYYNFGVNLWLIYTLLRYNDNDIYLKISTNNYTYIKQRKVSLSIEIFTTT